MRSSSWFGSAVALVTLLGAAAPVAAAEVSYVLEVPLTQGSGAVTSFVQGFGGTVQGGTFSGTGWTTTARSDVIEIPLPAGIDARHATLLTSVSDLELTGPTGYYESYVLVSLDTTGRAYEPTDTGKAGVQTLYVAWNEIGTSLRKPKGYFNLHDSTCTDWHNCTGEGATPNDWLGDGTGTYTVTHAWNGAVDHLTMTGGASNVQRNIDLTATSPTGTITAPQLYLLVNACGGSSVNACGLWDGTHHGGPLGVTYRAVRLEIFTECGDGQCSPHIEDATNCAADCGGGTGGSGSGAGGVGGSSVGGSGGAGLDGIGGATEAGGSSASGGHAGAAVGGSGAAAGGAPTGGAGATGAASPPGDASDDGGCSCRLTRSAGLATPWALSAPAVVAIVLARRRRPRRPRCMHLC